MIGVRHLDTLDSYGSQWYFLPFPAMRMTEQRLHPSRLQRASSSNGISLHCGKQCPVLPQCVLSLQSESFEHFLVQ